MSRRRREARSGRGVGYARLISLANYLCGGSLGSRRAARRPRPPRHARARRLRRRRATRARSGGRAADDRGAGGPSTVKEDSVELRGRVSPARASVEGARGGAPPVSNGAFSATVKLDEGVNVIDVSASMPGRSAAFAALRVTFDPRVTIPDLSGVQDDEAASKLDALGLDVSLDAVGGLFDELRSGPRRVCESDPPAGSVVDPGSKVTLKTAKAAADRDGSAPWPAGDQRDPVRPLWPRSATTSTPRATIEWAGRDRRRLAGRVAAQLGGVAAAAAQRPGAAGAPADVEVGELVAGDLVALELAAVGGQHGGAAALGVAGEDALDVAREHAGERAGVLGADRARRTRRPRRAPRRSRAGGSRRRRRPVADDHRGGHGRRQRGDHEQAERAAARRPGAAALERRGVRGRLPLRSAARSGSGSRCASSSVGIAVVTRGGGGGAGGDGALLLGDRLARGGGERRAAEVAGRRVAVLGVLGQRALDHAVELGGHRRALGRARRRLVQVRAHRLRDGVAAERRLAGQRREQHAAERVDVRARVARAPRAGARATCSRRCRSRRRSR